MFFLVRHDCVPGRCEKGRTPEKGDPDSPAGLFACQLLREGQRGKEKRKRGKLRKILDITTSRPRRARDDQGKKTSGEKKKKEKKN